MVAQKKNRRTAGMREGWYNGGMRVVQPVMLYSLFARQRRRVCEVQPTQAVGVGQCVRRVRVRQGTLQAGERRSAQKCTVRCGVWWR